MEEKEKEAEIFYQSSDSEEDEKTQQLVKVDENNKENKKNTEDTSTIQNSNGIDISDTQKLTQDYIQESHNKREILQQRSLDFGVPRKLFMDDIKEIEDTQNFQNNEYSNKQDFVDSENLAQLNKRPKEVTMVLKEASIPKKLFTTNTEEMKMDVDILEDIDMPEKKTENVNKSKDTSETNVAATEKTALHEDSTENFMLHLPETSNQITESNKTNREQKDDENIMIGETPFKSHKDHGKSEVTNVGEIEKPKDILQKSNEDSNKDSEIIDYNVLHSDFGLPPEFDEPLKKPTIKEKLLASALKFKPMIKASPGETIDFTDKDQIKEGVTKLLDRFSRHSMVRNSSNVGEISEVKVLHPEGSDNDITIVEEIFPMNAIIEDDPKKESKPGEKLKKLREDLKRKIATAKNVEWKQKEDKEKEAEEEEAKCKDDDFYAGLPDDEEILEDEESAESEPEENDILIMDKRRSKFEFGDEEAEESEDQGSEDNEVDRYEYENEEDEDENEEDEEEKENNEDDDTEKEEEYTKENVRILLKFHHF